MDLSFSRPSRSERLTPNQLALRIGLGTALTAAVILILGPLAPALRASHPPWLRVLGIVPLLFSSIPSFHYIERIKRGVQRHQWPTEDLAFLRSFVSHPVVRLLCVVFIAVWLACIFGAITGRWRYIFPGFSPYMVAMNLLTFTGALRPPDAHSQTQLTLDAAEPLRSTLWGNRGKM